MFDLAVLQAAVAAQGRVARVVVANVRGSVPRDAGAAMLVWAGGQSGTIGGGALEWEALAQARALLAKGGARFDTVPLGPRLGQCCGGSVDVLTEVFEAESLNALRADGILARPLPGVDGGMPLAVSRILAQARGQGTRPLPGVVAGWMVEPLAAQTRDLWIWGAGHVGRALVGVLSPLPDLAITWVDVARGKFPEVLPEGVNCLWAGDAAALAAHAPARAEHLVLTYSHALDLDLCHRLLLHGFGSLGLIGSATKAARFRGRLAALGHSAASIARIDCPIGDPALGKHPQQIAIGVAGALLRRQTVAKREIAV